MEGLPGDDRNIPSRADERESAGQLLSATVLGNEPLDIDASLLVRAGHHPQRIARSGRIELNLVVEAVFAFVPVWAVPMGYTVLVPGYRAAETGLLHEDHVVEGNEIIPIDGRGYGKELRMAIHAETRRHVLAHAAHPQNHVLGCITIRRRLGHL